MCGFITDTPPEHFSAANDGNGKIIDTTGKPQYTHGVMEYKIDSTSKPTPPTFVFCIDISSTSIMNGFFYQVVQSIKQCLDSFPYPEETSLCFVTFDNQAVQFYHLPLDPNAEPTVFSMGDLDDPFIPFPRESLMVNLQNDRERIDAFTDKLVTLYYTETRKYLPNQTC